MLTCIFRMVTKPPPVMPSENGCQLTAQRFPETSKSVCLLCVWASRLHPTDCTRPCKYPGVVSSALVKAPKEMRRRVSAYLPNTRASRLFFLCSLWVAGVSHCGDVQELGSTWKDLEGTWQFILQLPHSCRVGIAGRGKTIELAQACII